VVILGAPPSWAIAGLPDEVVVTRRRSQRRADVLVAFCIVLARLRDQVPGLAEQITPDGALWVAWPRRAGGHESDITDNLVREVVLPIGLVDVKVAALDDDWSALKMVWRKALRG